MSFRCLHMSDIHWRGLTRHEEYKEAFVRLIDKAKNLSPDVIFIGGDIVHSKTQGISPELIDCLNWWFTSMAEVCPVHVVLGNHDGLLMNKDRQDAITPIIRALANPNIFLYKDSGTYPTGIKGYNWCVFSCFDVEGWSNVKPVAGEVNIATFHGSVRGSLSDLDWAVEDEVDVDFFGAFDFAMLGDIHKFQFLNGKKTIAYPGSLIQQNYGESVTKGFLFWDIKGPNDFDVTFHELANEYPFITIDWSGDTDATIAESKKYPDRARFRVRTLVPITQAEIKLLYSSLKDLKHATEIVFKSEMQVDASVFQTDRGILRAQDLRDVNTQISLMRDFYKDVKINDEERNRIDALVQRYTQSASKSDTTRNIKWSIKKLEFDNMFAYGKGNVINFDDLNGVTGIFGRNRAGKSSIPGTLMYTLFNTTDRGPMSNLHVINSRKGHCQTKLTLSADGKNYVVERQSVKKTNKAGDESALTHVNLYEVDNMGNCIKDLNGEQRRETDTLLRSIVGTSEDFLLTSLAAQGSMNNFISNKATQRKSILTKFLDLEIFDEMHSRAKEDSSVIKAKLSDIPDRNWDALIDACRQRRDDFEVQRSSLEAKIATLRSHLDEIKIQHATSDSKNVVTQADIEGQEKLIEGLVLSIAGQEKLIADSLEQINKLNDKINTIAKMKSEFPIKDLRDRLSAQQDLERTIVSLSHSHESEKQKLKTIEKSIKLLDEVPCGDSFPTCKFIKDSHKNKKSLPDQIRHVDETLDKLKAAKKSLTVLQSEDLVSRLEKYDEILKKETDMHIKSGRLNLDLQTFTQQLSSMNHTLEESRRKLTTMRLNVATEETAVKISSVRREIQRLTDEMNSFDAQRLKVSEQIGQNESDILRYEAERVKYSDLIVQWRAYELFIEAVSHRGIPLKIMSTQLPVINLEISKILQGVVGFTVELESTPGTNDMEIYINYGDSRRVIECGSGMEKMMASLAIRVALINISSLPRADLLIIDEGFGALDETNVESCNRLLASFKKWFRNILVISHVDAVKDAVDNVLDITHHNMDSRIIYEKNI